jgi:pyridoxal phosphate enzyme (YggS family)
MREEARGLEVELRERIERVEETIGAAARRSGRVRDDITLVAVSKTVEPERIAVAAKLGLPVFGENRVQEAEEKRRELEAILGADASAAVRWHLIGHLQSNKARLATRLFSTIESVDSVRLASLLSRLAVERGQPISVLLEVNVGREESKFGFLPEDLVSAFGQLESLPGLDLRGLMTVAPIVTTPEAARPYFRDLRALRDRLIHEHPAATLPELSMGMTGDYPVAIEEGATIVRVGRAIFGERG